MLTSPMGVVKWVRLQLKWIEKLSHKTAPPVTNENPELEVLIEAVALFLVKCERWRQGNMDAPVINTPDVFRHLALDVVNFHKDHGTLELGPESLARLESTIQKVQNLSLHHLASYYYRLDRPDWYSSK